MPLHGPLTQQELRQTLKRFFGWADFQCKEMPRLNSYFCHTPAEGITFTDESMTHQSFKEEADINNIVDRYTRTGSFYDRPGTREPLFGDFSSGNDYNECLIALQEAREDFEALPSDIRKRFEHNPALLIAFMDDENNREEAISLGLIPSPSKAPSAGSPATPGQGEQATPKAPETKEPEAN